eukprot:10613723-Ditylum_brightwellii.AAC.1
MTPVSAGISNGENNQSGGTPTICEIMASQTQPREVNLSMTRLSVGVYMDQTGTGMCLYEIVEHPECVDIIGASDDVHDGMKSLPIGTYCAVVTSAT